MLTHWVDLYGKSRIQSGKLYLHLFRYFFSVCLGLRRRDARLETRRTLQKRCPSRVLRYLERERRPYFSAATREVDVGRHHSDQRVGLAVELYALPDDLLIRAEATLPQSIADQRNLLFARRILFGGEHSAELRRQTDHGAENSRPLHAAQRLRLIVGSQREARVVEGEVRIEALITIVDVREVVRR